MPPSRRSSAAAAVAAASSPRKTTSTTDTSTNVAATTITETAEPAAAVPSASSEADPTLSIAAATTTKKAARASKAVTDIPAAGTQSAAGKEKEKRDEPSTDAHIELLTEHFGYNPKTFIDGLVYLSNEHLYKLAEQFELFALDQLQDLDGGDLEAEQGVHAILTLLENALDHTMDTFELYCLRSVFGIKSRQAKMMTLDHHRGLDLRAQASVGAAAAKSSRSRKSVAGSSSSTTLTPNERSHKLGQEEDSLKRQIAAARATQHSLLLAKQAAEMQLSRATELHERFSALLAARVASEQEGGAAHDAGAAMTAILGQHARKLRADTLVLLRNLAELRGADPLGKRLSAVLSAAAAAGKTDGADGDEGEEEESATTTDLRAWEKGREDYLNWEAERIISKVKGEGDGRGDVSIEGDETTAKTPKRRKGGGASAANTPAAATPGTSKRKAKTATPASIKRPHLDQEAVVGEAAEMDKIAAALRGN